jgi:hypothetical protein
VEAFAANPPCNIGRSCQRDRRDTIYGIRAKRSEQTYGYFMGVRTYRLYSFWIASNNIHNIEQQKVTKRINVEGLPILDSGY